MRSKLPPLEWLVIVIGFGTYIGYHIWFLIKTGFGTKRQGYGVNGKGKVARIIFSDLVSSRKAGILGIQQNRNVMMGAAFQASICALFFNELLDILVTPNRLQTLQEFASVDPLLEPSEAEEVSASKVRIGQVTALAVVIINLGTILLSMMLFTVAVRLAIHSGYYYKTVGHKNPLISGGDAIKLTLETQAVYTLGQRLVFSFPITAMWFIGPLAMCITSVIVTVGVALLDTWNPNRPSSHISEILNYTCSDEVDEQEPPATAAEISRTIPPHTQHV